MRIGIPREIKPQENRVSTVPMTVAELIRRGHEVFVERDAGAGCGFFDEDYEAAGASILPDADAVFHHTQMIIKVKEPQPVEIERLKPEHLLFTYLHLAADKTLTERLVGTGCTAVAYETVSVNGKLPMLEPMSEVAGRMSVIYGSAMLAKHHEGSGVLIPGVPGVPAGKVMVIGGGTAGLNAAKIALGLGAEVTILDVSTERLRYLDIALPGVRTLYSTPEHINSLLPDTDLVIGAVLVPGAAAPKLIRREHLKRMKPGSVVVDIAVDQGGCCETTRPTTHQDPVYLEEGIVHYCVANMPGAYARTSTEALSNATRPWTLLLADLGVAGACGRRVELWNGINCTGGKLTCAPVAEAHGMQTSDAMAMLAG
ncbi:alanine dehydrogenase [Mucisphaera calidilacus]|uniref:Alanine dehydrogenase n=1 Tax=Mucisphaera calidilacus TaxID=2527982 RepID=A0A518BTV9_9BACT|nr:alanine dehydrogenase [Mucisphaera calidilacus]QDU70399.1 Alanine dehydrogenase [Mucisphaera calidilacus]